jgi:hypothetical protein
VALLAAGELTHLVQMRMALNVETPGACRDTSQPLRSVKRMAFLELDQGNGWLRSLH